MIDFVRLLESLTGPTGVHLRPVDATLLSDQLENLQKDPGELTYLKGLITARMSPAGVDFTQPEVLRLLVYLENPQ